MVIFISNEAAEMQGFQTGFLITPKRDTFSSISYYLSYIEFIPVVSVLSAIVHVICAIRDCVFGHKPAIYTSYYIDAWYNRSGLIKLSEHKLDDWSHSKKAILAAIPLLGNAILVFKWINRKLNLSKIYEYSHGYKDALLDHFPKKLWDDPEFVFSLMGLRSSSRPEIFERASLQIKEDKEFVMKLAENDLLKDVNLDLPLSLQRDKDIILAIIERHKEPAEFFKTLPEVIRNDLVLIKKILEICHFKLDFITHVSDKEILKSDKQIYLLAIQQGVFRYQDLDDSRRNQEEFAIALVKSNFRQWEELSDELKNNKNVLKAALYSLSSRTDYSFNSMKETELFKFAFKDLDSPRPQSVYNLRLHIASFSDNVADFDMSGMD